MSKFNEWAKTEIVFTQKPLPLQDFAKTTKMTHNGIFISEFC